jgi:drug/metabolite transporter (DMT)-like permease
MQERPPRPHVPVLIRIIGWFEIVGGVLAVVSGVVLIASRGWVLIVPGAVSVAAGWGLLNAMLWAYFTAMVIAAANIVVASPLLSLGRNVALFTLFVNAAILLILLNRESRSWAESLRAR